AAQNEPGLVAVPEGSDGVHHHVALLLAAGEGEQDGYAEIEAVEDDIHGHGGADEACPDNGEIPFHSRHPFGAVSGRPGPSPGSLPVASRAASSAADIGLLGRPAAASIASPMGPRLMSRLM